MARTKLHPLESLRAGKHTWTVDVLTIVRSLRQQHFSLQDVYAHEDRLKALHPNNGYVREKIRQQLQVLRDMGLLDFLGDGEYRLTNRPS